MFHKMRRWIAKRLVEKQLGEQGVNRSDKISMKKGCDWGIGSFEDHGLSPKFGC